MTNNKIVRVYVNSIKSILFLIISFLAISCDDNSILNGGAALAQIDTTQQELLSDDASDAVCSVNLNLFTKKYFDYQYDAGDHLDLYVDGQKKLNSISLKDNENVTSQFPVSSFGKHKIKLIIEIDSDESYTYPVRLCKALASLKSNGNSTELYNESVLKRTNSTVTVPSFIIEFEVYIYKNDYTLDIELGFLDETYDDGSSSGSYLNGNVNIYTYYQWTNITSAQTVYCDFIVDIIYDSTQQQFTYNKGFEQDLKLGYNGMIMNDVCWCNKTVRLPDGGDEPIGYKLQLITSMWAKLYSNIEEMLGETEVSWYSVYYRTKYNNGEYSEWYFADELNSSIALVDATIDFYSNLEIVCFKTKEIQDAYASEWGIVPYN